MLEARREEKRVRSECANSEAVQSEMIPRVIHYVWLGSASLPSLFETCITSWRTQCPDYRIQLWNEDNLVIDSPYYQHFLETKQWAFACDYARLWIVHHNGGIYLDTDIELLRPLDNLLTNRCYFGEEAPGCVNTGLGFGAAIEHPVVGAMLAEYDALSRDELPRPVPCPMRNTAALAKYGYLSAQKTPHLLEDTAVFAPEFFSPIDFSTGEQHITANTYSIHHFSGTWLSPTQRAFNGYEQRIQRRFPRIGWRAKSVAAGLASGFKTGDFSMAKESIVNILYSALHR